MNKITVLFPDGEREIPAHFNHIPLTAIGSPDALKHVPMLIPDDMQGWTFHQLMTGEYVALSATVHEKTRVPIRRYIPDEDEANE